MSHPNEILVRVADVVQVADRIKQFRFVAADGAPLPPFSGGAHITVMMDDGNRRIRNPYSLNGSPGGLDGYRISVLQVAGSRGGSRYLHTRVSPGDELRITRPGNLFPIHWPGRRHLLFAGGIGITPFLSMMSQLSTTGREFELHYAMRSAAAGAYGTSLQERYGDRVALYRTAAGQRIPVDDLLRDRPLGTHLYVCGPSRMIDSVLASARAAGWPDGSLHCERFLAPPAGESFVVRLARTRIAVRVGEHESILEAVEAAGLEPDYLCRGGACGQCETRVVSGSGTIEHHDHYLSPAERAAGDKIMICLSRFRGRELVLDL